MLQVYAMAEDRITLLLAKRLADGIDAPNWATRQLAAIQGVLHDTAALSRDLQMRGELTLASIITTSFSLGASAALRDIPVGGATQFGGINGRAVAALIGAIRGRLSPIGPIVQSSASHAIRQVVQESAAIQLGGTATRREATALALQRFADRGITGYRGTRGDGQPYRLTLASYAEMTARTMATHAIIQGHIDQLQTSGFDLVAISDAPEECVHCRPWEQKVLSTSGNTKAGSYTDDKGHAYTVSGSLAEAIAAKLFHPNCRHRTTLFVPGVTQLLHDTADPEGDKLRQTQRAYERQVRALKRRKIIADEIDPGGTLARKANADLRAKQAQFKQWRDDNGRKNLAYRTKPDFTQANPNSPELDAAAKARRALTVEQALRTAAEEQATRTAAAKAAQRAERAAERAGITRAKTEAAAARKAADKAERDRLRAASEDDLADEYGTALATETPEAEQLASRIEAEFDRREQLAARAEARRVAAEGVKAAEQERQWTEIGRLIEENGTAYEAQAIADVTGKPIHLVEQQLALRYLRDNGVAVPRASANSFDAVVRANYQAELSAEQLRAEQVTQGADFLSHDALARGVTDRNQLWTGTEAYARRNASPEIREYWDAHGRLTPALYRQYILDVATERNSARFTGPDYLQ